MLKNLLFLISLFLLSFSAISQSVCLGDDASLCIGDPLTIEICQSGGGINSTVFTLDNPQSFSLNDDYYTGMINLGFDFEFYGNSYNQIAISDNGMVSFNQVGYQYASWVVATIPSSTASALNTIMCVWQDLYQPHGGNIYYQTIGDAPNRIGVILWEGISMYSSSCQTADLCYTGAVLLFEGSNVIETHISNKTTCLAWGGGTATHGLNGPTGSIAHPVPGRNNSVFDIQNDGYRFTPNGPNDYILDPIPFSVVTSTVNPMIVWHDTEGESYPWNNGVLETTVGEGEIGYFVASSTCSIGVGAVSDTTFITGLSSSVEATATDDNCSAGVGTVTANPTSGSAPYSFSWPGLNATTQTVNNVTAGTYVVEMTDADGCASSATVTVGDNPADYPTSTTVVSCPGGNDGTATVEMVPALGNVTYQWNDPNNQTTSTAVGLSAGIYECTVVSDIGCSNTVQVEVTEIPGMDATITNQSDVTCFNGADGSATVNVIQGTGPYTYSWSESNSTADYASDLDFGEHTVTITDANGCKITEDVEIGQPDPLSITDISEDTIICIGDPVDLFVVGEGGSSTYSFDWYIGGELLANGGNVTLVPETDSTSICVIMTEECGSPQVSLCMNVYYPEEVTILLDPDKTGDCYPVEVNFENITETEEVIDYTVWKYSDGYSDTTQGYDPTSHEFGEGFHSILMTVVTERGCVYEQNFSKIIEGYSHPNPNFYVNPSPASVYDPVVHAYSQTDPDVISYTWIAEGANPSVSTLKNPTFRYPNEVKNYPLTLIVQNEYGCIDSIQRLVRIENDVLLFAPNSFTPDGDGFNDSWGIEISGVDIYDFHLQVFNRWGEMVFESYDPKGIWDGTFGPKKAPAGSYVWKISAMDYENDNKYEFNGVVTILR